MRSAGAESEGAPRGSDEQVRRGKARREVGPNGFFRQYQGGVKGKRGANLVVTATYDREPGITLELVNRGRNRETLHIYDAYAKRSLTQSLGSNAIMIWHWPLEGSHGWYDLITTESDSRFRQQLAGHVETGRNSASDPALGV